MPIKSGAVTSARSGFLNPKLLTCTTMLAGALLGYGHNAYAQQICSGTGGANFVCSGVSSDEQVINVDNASVTTSGTVIVNTTSLDPNTKGFRIEGYGAISFLDFANTTITTAAGDGLFVTTYGDDGPTAGSIVINTTANITGYEDGIDVGNYGTGSTFITVSGNVTGQTLDALYAVNYNTGSINIVQQATSTVLGEYAGIYAYQRGTGDVSIMALGTVTGTTDHGIIVAADAGPANISVTTGAGAITGYYDAIAVESYVSGNVAISTGTGAILGDYYGIRTIHSGATGNLSVTTGGGSVTGTNADGIYLYNRMGDGDITIQTGVGAVMGGDDGIDAYHHGNNGNLFITTGSGAVTGADKGIEVQWTVAGDTSIQTGSGGVMGGNRGIDLNKYSDGDVTISTGSGLVYGGNRGIDLRDISGDGSIAINVGAGGVAGGGFGIFVDGASRDMVNINVSGDVTAGDNDAIRVVGSSATRTVNIDVAAGATVQSMGGDIFDRAIQSLDAATNVTIAGTLIGGNGQAVRLSGYNDSVTLRGGFAITGTVNARGAGAGGDTLNFGGDPTGIDGTLDVGLIGAGQQFLNFENFAKTGASTFTLTGVNNSLGRVDVFDGTLFVNAEMTSTRFIVEDGGTLAGDGTVRRFRALAGSNIAPGASAGGVGTMMLTERARFDAGSTFWVDLGSGTMADRVDADDAQLNGGTVQVGGNLAGTVAGQDYLIVDTMNGVTGEFDAVEDPSAFVTFVLDYSDANQVRLVVAERQAFGAAALTENQRSVALALDGLDGSEAANVVENALLLLTFEEARAAFDALSGDAHAEAASAALGSAEDFARFLLSFSGTSGGGVQTATLGAPVADAAGYGADLLGGSAGYSPTFWYGGFGGYAQVDGDGNGAGYDSTAFGLAGGVENRVDALDSVVGLSLGYSFSDLDVNNRLQEAHTRNFHAGLYARHGADRLQEGFAARGALTYAHHWVETSRTIAFGAINSTAAADYNGFTLSADAEARYNMAVDLGVLDKTFVSPFARLAWRHTDLGSFTETGAGVLNLSGDADGYNHATAALGVAVAGEHMIGNAVWRPSVSVAYEYAAGDDSSQANLTLAGSPVAFTTQGTEESRHRVRFGTLSEFAVSDSASFIFATDSVYSEDRSEISAKAGVKFTF